MISSLNDIKQGLCLKINNEPYQVVEAHFMRCQQRKPVMQTKLKNLLSGKVLEINFKPGDKVEEADLEKHKANFLYQDAQGYFFMDNETFEQFNFSAEQLNERVKFLKEGIEVIVLYFNNQPVNIELPKKIDYKVISSPPAVRGDTAQGSATKQVTLETGLIVNAPLFVKEGDILRVNTDTGLYVERV
ncbi:MAG: elongation factor P [bacterium]